MVIVFCYAIIISLEDYVACELSACGILRVEKSYLKLFHQSYLNDDITLRQIVLQ